MRAHDVTAPADLPIRCSCGALRGYLRGAAARHGNRVVCYCDDCQSFAHFLGRPQAVLDVHGGTDIFQTSPARVEITAGIDRLACVRLRPNGPLRWYASCCCTPIGNTPAVGWLPFVGLVHSCLAADEANRDAVLGPVRVRAMGRFAKGDVSGLRIHASFPLRLIARVFRLVITARLRGDHKRSHFFSGATLTPVVVPKILSEEELRKVEQARDRA